MDKDRDSTPETPGLVLRRAERADAGQILAFIRALGAYEKLEHEISATRADIESTLFGERPVAEVVIADFEEQAAGFVLFFPNYSTFLGAPGLYIEDLFVLPEYRGRGIGRRLLCHVAALAEARGWRRVDWMVLDWNEPALRFYASIGARAMRDWIPQRLSGEALSRAAREPPRAALI